MQKVSASGRAVAQRCSASLSPSVQKSQLWPCDLRLAKTNQHKHNRSHFPVAKKSSWEKTHEALLSNVLITKPSSGVPFCLCEHFSQRVSYIDRVIDYVYLAFNRKYNHCLIINMLLRNNTLIPHVWFTLVFPNHCSQRDTWRDAKYCYLLLQSYPHWRLFEKFKEVSCFWQSCLLFP